MQNLNSAENQTTNDKQNTDGKSRTWMEKEKKKDETRKLDSNKGQTTDYDENIVRETKMMTKQLWQ